MRERVLELGISQVSGGSKTSVGGYADGIEEQDSAQFEIVDDRNLDEVVHWLLDQGHIPSFCTACYREGRTGDRFMSFAKSGEIGNYCQPNALMTLEEYLEDYASEETKIKGYEIIEKEVQNIPEERVRNLTQERLKEIKTGKRDFRL